MPKYRVEEIYGDTVVLSGDVVETNPREAAETLAGQPVSPGVCSIIGSECSMRRSPSYMDTAWLDLTNGLISWHGAKAPTSVRRFVARCTGPNSQTSKIISTIARHAVSGLISAISARCSDMKNRVTLR